MANGDTATANKQSNRIPVPVTAAQSKPSLATNCKPGMRFPSYQVLAQSDARPWHMHHKMPSDGRFRLVVFAGDILSPRRQKLVNDLGAWLAANILSVYPTIKLSPAADPHNNNNISRFKTDRDLSVVDVLLIHTAERREVDLLRGLHETYHPFDSKLGWDYDKVLVDAESYHSGHGRAYEGYGVDPGVGALVIVRPDGYVGLVTALEQEGWEEVGEYFQGVLRTV